MKLRIISILVFIFAAELFGQGMNNNFAIDSVDNLNVYNMLGIDVFKFPMHIDSGKRKFKIIMVEYTDNKLTGTSVITEGLPDDCQYLDTANRIFRVYSQFIDRSKMRFKLDIKGVAFEFNKNFVTDSIGMQQSRAYSDFLPIHGKKIPFFIWYGFREGKTNRIHCPGNSVVEKVAEFYDFVTAFYIEIE